MLKTLKFALTLVTSTFIFSTTFAQKEKERIDNYIAKYKELAMKEMLRSGVPAAITLAQGLLETGYGQSDLALNANNHFGIKCKTEWTGEKIFHDDDAKGECFRKYASVEDSYKDHSDFLKTRGHYSFLFSIDPTDYQAWAHGLKKAGYATNPTYAQRLIAFIEENNLQEYSLMALNKIRGNETFAKAESKQSDIELAIEEDLVAKQEAFLNNTSSINTSFRNNSVGDAVANRAEKRSSISYPKNKIFSINALKVIYVEEGTSLFAVAANNGVSFTKLLEFNDLAKVDIVEKDQLIFLEKKQRKGEKEVHVVQENENLHDVSQKEGIQLSSLIELNHLAKNVKLAPGQKLYLKTVAPTNERLAAGFTSIETSSSMR